MHDKEFRIVILRMLRELQDLMKLGKQYTNKMRTSTKYVENIKKNQTSFAAEEYNNWTEEFNREHQQ